MTWTIEFDKKSKKEFKKLDRAIQKQIDKFLFKIKKQNNPFFSGEPLIGNLKSLWRYRVGDYRLICKIEKEILTILVLHVGHRKEVYK